MVNSYVVYTEVARKRLNLKEYIQKVTSSLMSAVVSMSISKMINDQQSTITIIQITATT